MVLKGLLRAFALLPLPANHALGTLLGWCALVVPNRPRRIAEANIDRCFAESSPSQRKRLLRRSLAETGKAFTEVGPLWHWRGSRMLALVREVRNEALVHRAYGQGRGVVFAAPHLGAWELAGLYVSARYPVTGLYRPPRLADLENLLTVARTRTGARMVPANQDGIRALYRALKAGEGVFVLPDQEPRQGSGVFAPFFGHMAKTMVLVSRLSNRTQAPIILVYAERLARGRGYRIHFEEAPAEASLPQATTAAAHLNQAVEACVRQHPTQYQWTYKRFRSQPAGEPGFYPPNRRRS